MENVEGREEKSAPAPPPWRRGWQPGLTLRAAGLLCLGWKSFVRTSENGDQSEPHPLAQKQLAAPPFGGLEHVMQPLRTWVSSVKWRSPYTPTDPPAAGPWSAFKQTVSPEHLASGLAPTSPRLCVRITPPTAPVGTHGSEGGSVPCCPHPSSTEVRSWGTNSSNFIPEPSGFRTPADRTNAGRVPAPLGGSRMGLPAPGGIPKPPAAADSTCDVPKRTE